MSDVFISYASQDRPVAEKLCKELTDNGYDVWWDTELRAGQDFHNAILAALDACEYAVVIWSPNSIKSEWVYDEAKRAAADEKLISTHVPGFNLRNLPLGFGRRHCVDVTQFHLILDSITKIRTLHNRVNAELVTRFSPASLRGFDISYRYNEPPEEAALSASELAQKYSGKHYQVTSIHLHEQLDVIKDYISPSPTSATDRHNQALLRNIISALDTRSQAIPIAGRVVDCAFQLVNSADDELQKVGRFLTRVTAHRVSSLVKRYAS